VANPGSGRIASAASLASNHLARPTTRAWLVLITLLAFASLASPAVADEGFRRFVDQLWPEAQAFGVSRSIFEAAFRGVEPDTTLPDLILPGRSRPEPSHQAEFSKTAKEYIDQVQIAHLTEQGRSLLAQHGKILAQIENELGVDRTIVLAIWGRETAFGGYKLPHYAIRVLATQAYLGRRSEMFRRELLFALKMLEDRVITPAAMKSSWAGAMGLTQFMPSDFYAFAYDMDKDGKKDIWTSLPDALGSAANQLKVRGWVRGQPWGFEVRLPPSGTCLWEGIPKARRVREWSKLGITRADGRPIEQERLGEEAFIVLPAGIHGPAFLAFENYKVIKQYNMSDLYVLFVGHLADRIAGGGNFLTPWPNVRQLPNRDIEEIQQRLKALGYDVEKIDGRAGMNTRNLIGTYQNAKGLVVDCWPSQALLTHVRSLATR
jgi:lytic murein transglycosylase